MGLLVLVVVVVVAGAGVGVGSGVRPGGDLVVGVVVVGVLVVAVEVVRVARCVLRRRRERMMATIRLGRRRSTA